MCGVPGFCLADGVFFRLFGLVNTVFDTLAELLGRSTERSSELGQLGSTEQQQHDDENDQKLWAPETANKCEHGASFRY
jgi:hypothetical protein